MAKSRLLSVDNLIASVKRRAMLPQNQVTFAEDDFLAFANEEMDMGIVPHLMSFHEDYLIATELVDVANGTGRYKIPHRAVGNKLRDVRFQDDSGNLYEMTRIQKEDEMYFQYNSAGSSSLRAFMVEADEIVLPNGTIPSIGGTLSIVYYLRPNELVVESRTCKIVSIDTILNKIVVNSYPDVFVGETTFDITSHKSPYKLSVMNLKPTVLATPLNLTFTLDSIPTNLNVGDVMALTEETTIPQIPVELQSMLAQRVAIRCLEALGDTQGLTNAMAKLQEMEAKTGSIVDDRVEGSPKKVINFHTFLRSQRKWNRR